MADEQTNMNGVEESGKATDAGDQADDTADDKCKIIVRHLNYKTVEKTIEEYFQKYGKVKSVDIKKDPDGSSRGFGFVVFENEADLQEAIKEEKQTLDSHEVLVSLPKPLSEKLKTNMLFLGGVPKELPEEDIKEYFGKYGEVKELSFSKFRDSGERKNFAFLHFETTEAVDKVMSETKPPHPAVHKIGEHSVDCRKKFPEDHPETKKLRQRQQAKQRGGWGAGGWGGYQGGRGGYSYGGAQGGYGGYQGGYGGYQGGYAGYGGYYGGGGYDGYSGGGYGYGGYGGYGAGGGRGGPMKGRGGRGGQRGYSPY